MLPRDVEPSAKMIWARRAQAAAPTTILYQLFVLNIALQMFDGVATYAAVNLGWPEGNVLLLNSFLHWGVGPSLLLFKALACAVLLLLYWKADAQLATWAFGAVAVVYCVCSLIPWSAILIATAIL